MADLCMYVVYDHPKDYPDSFVARIFELDKPTDKVFEADNIEAIRAMLETFGLVNIGRTEGDDPRIVEVWV